MSPTVRMHGRAARRLHRAGSVDSLVEAREHSSRSLPARRAEGAPAEITYWTRALGSPVNLVLLVVLTVTCLATQPWLLLVLVPTFEAFYMGLVPRSKSFRKSVDREVAREDRQRRREALESRLCRMSPEHRSEYEEIEGLVESLRQRAQREDIEHLLLCEHLRLDELLESYLELSMHYVELARHLSLTASASGPPFFGRVPPPPPPQHGLPQQHPFPSDGPGAVLAELIRKRQAIAREREQCRATCRARLHAIEHQLALVADVVRLAHERAMVPNLSVDRVRREVDRVLEDLDGFRGGLREAERAAVVASSS
jgi:hypothetical protein